VDFYNLGMIISVGYRVKSHVATRFRIWATQRLKEFIVKGCVLDDERLKNPDQPWISPQPKCGNARHDRPRPTVTTLARTGRPG
jgi:Virulence protein RhuM family